MRCRARGKKIQRWAHSLGCGGEGQRRRRREASAWMHGKPAPRRRSWEQKRFAALEDEQHENNLGLHNERGGLPSSWRKAPNNSRRKQSPVLQIGHVMSRGNDIRKFALPAEPHSATHSATNSVEEGLGQHRRLCSQHGRPECVQISDGEAKGKDAHASALRASNYEAVCVCGVEQGHYFFSVAVSRKSRQDDTGRTKRQHVPFYESC